MVLTWQIPVLGKYCFRPESTMRPTLEAGPPFRVAGNLNGYCPSRYGFSTSGGIEMDYKALRIAPVIAVYEMECGFAAMVHEGRYGPRNQLARISHRGTSKKPLNLA